MGKEGCYVNSFDMLRICKGYRIWVNRGKGLTPMDLDSDMDGECDEDSYDDIKGLLNDRFRDVAHGEGVYESPNEDAKRFFNLVDKAK